VQWAGVGLAWHQFAGGLLHMIAFHMV
jgi:hypothetical protein